ncbi:MAG: NAD(P)H-dependent oxidoreductase [Alicyclobacillaceae bacterium]|nr:NAD(P)H-dependent oxidoreductase [Alicyclobacillaceae bacterium]
MRMLALVGSLRKESYNLRLVLTMQERYRDRFSLEVADLASLPLYNQDAEDNPPEPVRRLKQKVAEADGVIIATPEYNWSIPGVLKNALDWLSRGERVLVQKPVLTVGVTPFMLGTIRAQLHLREILAAPGISARVLPPAGNEILITFAKDKFEEPNGRLVHAPTLELLDTVVDKFLDLVRSAGTTGR